MKIGLVSALLLATLGLAQVSAPAMSQATRSVEVSAIAEAQPTIAEVDAEVSDGEAIGASEAGPEPLVVLMRSASWFVYPRGCDTVAKKRDVVLHFHGAHTTVIPRYLESGVDAVLIIINKGIGSGAYSDALAIDTQVDDLLARVETAISEQCAGSPAGITRLALSSWSAGYGATEQFLRWRPSKVDAVLLADGLHVGFSERRSRAVDAERLDIFADFARQAARGKKLMAITHSAIKPVEYAGSGETAQILSDAAHSPTWPVTGEKFGMQRLTTSRRGQFYVEGFAGADKAAHADHLYAIGETSFARLRDHWRS